MANEKNLRPFRKGPDARRNLKGRPSHPKNFNELRKAIQEFLEEPSGKNKTRLMALLAQSSKNQQGRKMILEYAYGRVPLKIEGPGANGEIKIAFVDQTTKKEV